MKRPKIFAVVRLLFTASPARAAVFLGLVLTTGLLSVLQKVAYGLIVGSIPAAVRSGLDSPEGRRLVMVVLVSAGVTVGSSVLGILQNLTQTGLTYRFGLLVNGKLMSAALDPSGIAHMEDPKFIDELALVQGTPGTESPTAHFPQAFGTLIAIRVGAAGSALLLLRLAWWAPLLLLAAIAFAYRFMTKRMDLVWLTQAKTTSDIRRAGYFRGLAMNPPAGKEIRVFGLATWVVERFSSHLLRGLSQVWAERRRMNVQMLGVTLALLFSFGLVFVEMGRAGIEGRIGLAEVAIYAQAALGLITLIYEGSSINQVRNAANAVERLLDLPTLAKRLSTQPNGQSVDVEGLPRSEIRLTGVEFAYPGTEHKVFDGLDLVIPAGGSIAIVGVNGAGKTTLVKLLTRLYDPDEGSITVDGVDLATLDPEAWRRRVAAIFQDFVRYPLSARDNVAFGAPHRRGDQAALDRAVQMAGADTIIESLPQGWDTFLVKEVSGGTDLSGGQWQKVALARALFAAAQGGLLILDEPTAALDIRAEAELFNRFLQITKGTTSILISHRFSTVRRADRICVIESGRLIECGSHAELMTVRGRYAQMFSFQAARFTEEEVEDSV